MFDVLPVCAQPGAQHCLTKPTESIGREQFPCARKHASRETWAISVKHRDSIRHPLIPKSPEAPQLPSLGGPHPLHDVGNRTIKLYLKVPIWHLPRHFQAEATLPSRQLPMPERENPSHASTGAIDALYDVPFWGPGLRVVRQRGFRAKALLLLLLSWLAVILLSMLAFNWMGAATPAWPLIESLKPEPLRGMADTGWPLMRWASPGVLGLVLIAVLYLAACTWRSMEDQPGAVWPRPGSADRGLEPAHLPVHDDATPALASDRPDDAGGLLHSKPEAFDILPALQLGNQQIGAAIGEAARRTITLCGAFDSCTKHVEDAGADLDAIQDEAAHTQQVMAVLRALLLKVGSHCQALGSAAHRLADPAAHADAARHIDELKEVLDAGVARCHQLTERIGAAEHSSGRRIESIRRHVVGLGYQAERGLREGHQVMVLTRQIQASLAESAQRLQKSAGAWAMPEEDDDGKPPQAQEPLHPA